MGIKYSMKGFIKYLKIITVGKSKQGVTDLNEKSHITVGHLDCG